MVAEGDRSPDGIRSRLRTAPTHVEWLIIGSIVIILVASMGYSGHGIDWEIFAGAADGSFTSDRGLSYYYAYWLLPIFDLYAIPGVAVGGLLWALTNMGGVWFAARVFGARSAVVLAGFGTLSGFYTGTITGIALAAIAGVWWAAHEKRWDVVGALSLLAVAKPQWGVPMVIMIVLHARPPWRAWVRMAWAPLLVALGSFAYYGWWPSEVITRAQDAPPEGNGSLWFFLGPAVLVLWLPLALPMDARRRLALVAATSLMALPYAQQYDYVVLWVLAGDGIGLLSHFHGLLSTTFGREGARGFQTVMPLAMYAILAASPIQTFLKARKPFGSGGRLEQPA